MSTAEDAYLKLYGWIDSCESKFHFDCADILVELFLKKFPDEKEKHQMLIDLKHDKWQLLFKPIA